MWTSRGIWQRASPWNDRTRSRRQPFLCVCCILVLSCLSARSRRWSPQFKNCRVFTISPRSDYEVAEGVRHSTTSIWNGVQAILRKPKLKPTSLQFALRYAIWTRAKLVGRLKIFRPSFAGKTGSSRACRTMFDSSASGTRRSTNLQLAQPAITGRSTPLVVGIRRGRRQYKTTAICNGTGSGTQMD
jgi:hypothetical protein